MAARSYGQYCGVTTAVELVGERWALLIVRDLLVGPRRYSDLKTGLPKIPTNILAARLKELTAGGVVRRVAGAGGVVYELTEYGQALEPIVILLGQWGFQQMGDPEPGDVVTPASLTMALRTSFQADAAARLPATHYELHVGEIALRADVDSDGLRVSEVGAATSADDADIVIVAGPGIRAVISGEVTPADAVDRDILNVPRGDETLLERFATTFHIDPAPVPA